jgi:hypothetical protein
MRRRLGILLVSAAFVAALVPSAASAATPPSADGQTQMALDKFRADVRARVAAPYRHLLYHGKPAGLSAYQWNEAMIQKVKAETAALKALNRSERRLVLSYWAAVTQALRSPVLSKAVRPMGPAGVGAPRR